MTYRILSLIIGLVAALSINAQTDNKLFPLPTIPEELTTLQDRTDYLLDHYWEPCDMKAAYSNKAQLADAFRTYASFITLGSREKAMASIDALLKKLEKHPDALLFIVDQANGYFQSDTAEVASDEAYIPFAKAAVANKKVDKASKLRYGRQVKILENNMEGRPVADIPYTTIDGRKSSLAADTAALTIIFFNNPDCDDCQMAKAQLDANFAATQMLKNGDLKIIAVTPDDDTPQWREAMKSYPTTWDVTALPDAYDLLDIRHTPSFYVLDKEHKIIYKNLAPRGLMSILQRL